MRRIDLNPHERRSGAWRPASLAAATAAIAEDGVVVLGGVVPDEPIAALREKMASDLARAEALGRVRNDFQGIRPPPCAPWLFDDILHNDWVVAVTHAILGDGLANTNYGANTAYAGSDAQGCHADVDFEFPGFAHPSGSLVVNIPLVDVDLANGATRLWPGSHLYLGARNHMRPTADELTAWEARRPTERACARRGDAIIRDPRLWHGGTPNTTPVARPMLAMIHARSWVLGGFCAEQGTEDFFERHPVLRHRVEFVAAPLDYLHPHHSTPTWCQPRPAADGRRRGAEMVIEVGNEAMTVS